MPAEARGRRRLGGAVLALTAALAAGSLGGPEEAWADAGAETEAPPPANAPAEAPPPEDGSGQPRYDLALPEGVGEPGEVRISDRPPGVPDDATLEARGAVIGEVLIRAGDVFDPTLPAEDKLLFRFANRIHRSTRLGVIENLLLIRPGDPYSRRRLEESERLLRATRYLYDAQIRPVAYRDNRVDLEVITRDVWTLTAGFGLSRAGGENATNFKLQDSNFLGTGRDVAIGRSTDVDRTSTQLKYRDLSLAGTRASLEMWMGENSDGDTQRLELEKPFYALDVRWAAGLFYRDVEEVDRLWAGGEVFDRFSERRTFGEVYAGRSSGLRGRGSRRWKVGFTYDRHRFSQAPKEFYPDDPQTELPVTDRTLAYPWIGFEWIEDRYLEVSDVDQLQRTEDLYAGTRIDARIGYSPRALADDRDRVVFAAGLESGFKPGRGSLLLLDAAFSGRWAGSEGHENVIAGVGARYYRRTFGRHLLFASFGADAVERLDAEEQLLLGGDTGLRGYPLRYQAGDRRLLFTVEQRFYTDLHLFRLLHVGGAVFADVGRAWYVDDPPKSERQTDQKIYRLGWLSDVGFGLRLGSSRSGQGAMIHLDVAFPLDRDPSIESVQWLVSTKETF